MQDDFGIVPMPKYDAEQEQYYSKTDQYGLLFGVPVSASNLDRVGEIMEYMAWLSNDTVLPAYYEVNLKDKKIRDARASEMLDLIKNSRFYVISSLIGVNVVDAIVNGFIEGNIASAYDSKKSSFETKLEDILEYIS